MPVDINPEPVIRAILADGVYAGTQRKFRSQKHAETSRPIALSRELPTIATSIRLLSARRPLLRRSLEQQGISWVLCGTPSDTTLPREAQ